MKKFILTLAVALLNCAPLMAAETPAVPTALANTSHTYLTETKPAAEANFYVYLCSASWCGPCRAIMPQIIKEYPQIKAAGGEIILLCFDLTPEAGKAYVKKYNAVFPAILTAPNKIKDIEPLLPGFKAPRGIPYVAIVRPDGTCIHAGHGATLLKWREIINK